MLCPNCGSHMWEERFEEYHCLRSGCKRVYMIRRLEEFEKEAEGRHGG